VRKTSQRTHPERSFFSPLPILLGRFLYWLFIFSLEPLSFSLFNSLDKFRQRRPPPPIWRTSSSEILAYPNRYRQPRHGTCCRALLSPKLSSKDAPSLAQRPTSSLDACPPRAPVDIATPSRLRGLFSFLPPLHLLLSQTPSSLTTISKGFECSEH